MTPSIRPSDTAPVRAEPRDFEPRDFDPRGFDPRDRDALAKADARGHRSDRDRAADDKTRFSLAEFAPNQRANPAHESEPSDPRPMRRKAAHDEASDGRPVAPTQLTDPRAAILQLPVGGTASFPDAGQTASSLTQVALAKSLPVAADPAAAIGADFDQSPATIAAHCAEAAESALIEAKAAKVDAKAGVEGAIDGGAPDLGAGDKATPWLEKVSMAELRSGPASATNNPAAQALADTALAAAALAAAALAEASQATIGSGLSDQGVGEQESDGLPELGADDSLFADGSSLRLERLDVSRFTTRPTPVDAGRPLADQVADAVRRATIEARDAGSDVVRFHSLEHTFAAVIRHDANGLQLRLIAEDVGTRGMLAERLSDLRQSLEKIGFPGAVLSVGGDARGRQSSSGRRDARSDSEAFGAALASGSEGDFRAALDTVV